MHLVTLCISLCKRNDNFSNIWFFSNFVFFKFPAYMKVQYRSIFSQVHWSVVYRLFNKQSNLLGFLFQVGQARMGLYRACISTAISLKCPVQYPQRPNCKNYTDEILRPRIKPPIDHHALADRAVFIHDGATLNVARISQKCLTNATTDVFLWLANIPDINVIENVWTIISRLNNNMNQLPQNAAELCRMVEHHTSAIRYYMLGFWME